MFSIDTSEAKLSIRLSKAAIIKLIKEAGFSFPLDDNTICTIKANGRKGSQVDFYDDSGELEISFMKDMTKG